LFIWFACLFLLDRGRGLPREIKPKPGEKTYVNVSLSSTAAHSTTTSCRLLKIIN
jgi:hypothetical protein